MLGRSADLGLVAKHFLGQRRPRRSWRARSRAGRWADDRSADRADERDRPEAACRMPERFAGEQAVEAFRRELPRPCSSGSTDCGRPARLLRRARPSNSRRREARAAARAAATCWKAREAEFAVAQPPRGKAGDPGGLGRPVADRALAPGVGDPPRVHVEPEHIIDEGDALVAGFGPGFDGKLRREGQQLRLGAGGVVGLDQADRARPGAGRRTVRPGPAWRDSGPGPSRGSRSAVSRTISGGVVAPRLMAIGASWSACGKLGRLRRSAPGARRGRRPASPWRCRARPSRPASGCSAEGRRCRPAPTPSCRRRSRRTRRASPWGRRPVGDGTGGGGGRPGCAAAGGGRG